MSNNGFTPAENIEILRAGSVVRRYHCFDVLANENVGKHCYGSICFAYVLCNGEPSSNIIKYLTFHDSVEQYTGDMPSPFKNADEELMTLMKKIETKIQKKFGFYIKLMKNEMIIAKGCDVLDGIYYSIEEIRRGNKNFAPIFLRWLNIFKDLPLDKYVDENILKSINRDIIKMKDNFKLTHIDERDCWRHFKKVM